MSSWQRVQGVLGGLRTERVTLDTSAAAQKDETAVGLTNVAVAVVRLAGSTVSYVQSPNAPSRVDLDRYWLNIGDQEVYFDVLVLPHERDKRPARLPEEMEPGVVADAVATIEDDGKLRAAAIVLPCMRAVFWCGSARAGRYALAARYLRYLALAAAGLALVLAMFGITWQVSSEDGASWTFLGMFYAAGTTLPAAMLTWMFVEDLPGAREAESIFRSLGWHRPGWVDLEKQVLRRRSWADGGGMVDQMCRLPH